METHVYKAIFISKLQWITKLPNFFSSFDLHKNPIINIQLWRKKFLKCELE